MSRLPAVVTGVLLTAVVALSMLAFGPGGSLEEAPVALVAPDVVAVPLAEDVTRATVDGLRLVPREERDDADRLLADGAVLAVLVVDLSGTQDELVVAPVGSDRLRDAVVDQVVEVERSYGRTVSTTDAAPDSRVPQPATLGALACVGGWALVVVVSLVRGPCASTLRGGLARRALVAAVAVTTGAVAAAWSGEAVVGLAVGAAVGGAALTTLAAEALVGLPGIVLAAVLLVVSAVPVVRTTDTLFLPEALRVVLDGTLTGAVAEALRAGTGPGLGGWPLATLVLWTVLPLGVLVAVRVLASRPGTDGTTAADADLPVPGRRRVAVALVLVLVVGLAGTARATTVGRRAPDPVADLASGSECADTGTVDSVDDLNRVTRLRGDDEFRGGDVGVEAALQDGRLIWFFGDTLRAAGSGTGSTFVRNSALLVEPGCLRVMRPVGGGAVVRDRRDGVGYWPMSLTVDPRPGYDVVTVLLQRVRSTGDTTFAFESLGPAAAVLVAPVGEAPQVVTVRDLGPDDADVERPMWGAASVVDDGWLHLSGTARPDDGSSFGFSLSVARVRPADVLDRRAWRYWDGAAWVPRADAAAELVPAVGGVSQTLSVFRRGDTWYALSKRDDFLGRDLVFWTAPSPHGPFTAQPPTAELPSDLPSGQLRYMPLAHPDLFLTPGTVIVSYSRNSTDVGAVIDDPLLYRPRFLRVPLPTPGS